MLALSYTPVLSCIPALLYTPVLLYIPVYRTSFCFRYTAPTKYNSFSSGGTDEKSHACAGCFFYCAPCWSWCTRVRQPPILYPLVCEVTALHIGI